jgi:hypothetical protein
VIGRPRRVPSVAVVGLAALAVLLVVGCSSLVGPRVTVINDTEEVFTIEADGTWVGTVGPGARATLGIPLADDQTEVVAIDPFGDISVSLQGTRAMYEAAFDGSGPMSAWQERECGRILLATEPFEPALAGPIPNPCP